MAKTVFVSIVHEDKKDVIHTIENWHRQGFLGPIDFIFEKEDVRSGGDKAIEDYLGKLLDKSQVIVFITGQNTYNHKWVEWEHTYAKKATGKRLVYFRIKGTTGIPPASFPVSEDIPKLDLENFKKWVL